MTNQKQIEREIKADLETFLQNEPEPVWTDPQGKLTVSEKRERVRFAEKHTSQTVRDWLEGRDLSLTDLVDSDPQASRFEFCLVCFDELETLEKKRHAKKS